MNPRFETAPELMFDIINGHTNQFAVAYRSDVGLVDQLELQSPMRHLRYTTSVVKVELVESPNAAQLAMLVDNDEVDVSDADDFDGYVTIFTLRPHTYDSI